MDDSESWISYSFLIIFSSTCMILGPGSLKSKENIFSIFYLTQEYFWDFMEHLLHHDFMRHFGLVSSFIIMFFFFFSFFLIKKISIG